MWQNLHFHLIKTNFFLSQLVFLSRWVICIKPNLPLKSLTRRRKMFHALFNLQIRQHFHPKWNYNILKECTREKKKHIWKGELRARRTETLLVLLACQDISCAGSSVYFHPCLWWHSHAVLSAAFPCQLQGLIAGNVKETTLRLNRVHSLIPPSRRELSCPMFPTLALRDFPKPRSPVGSQGSRADGPGGWIREVCHMMWFQLFPEIQFQFGIEFELRRCSDEHGFSSARR